MSDKGLNNQAGANFFHPDLLEVPADGAPAYLKGYRCRACGQLDFPKLSPCPACWSDDFEVVPLNRKGKLYSMSDIFVGQSGMKTPYTFGYVDLPENLRIFCQLKGEPGSFRCDEEVELTVGTIRVDKEGVPLISYMFVKASV